MSSGKSNSSGRLGRLKKRMPSGSVVGRPTWHISRSPWRAACSLKGLSAAACYYGGGMTTADEVARQPQVPVLAHFGQHDHWISVDSVQAFARAHPDVQVHVYDADHGFNCDQRGSYDEASALVARDRTLAFFAKHVG